MLGVLWSVGSILEFAAVDIDLKIFWRKFQVIFQLPSATAITCFLLEYAQPKRWLTRRNLILLASVPLLAALVIITNPIHNLFWEGFDFDGGLVSNAGPLMPYFIAYVFVNFLMNLGIFVWLFIHSPQNHWPVVIMVVGQVMMRLFYFIDFADRAAIHLPYSVVGIAITSLLYAVVFFRFKIFGPIPIARQAMIEQLPMGMIVIDELGKIHNINPTAERMLNITNKNAKGLDVLDLLPFEVRDTYIKDSNNPIEFERDIKGDKRYLMLNVSSLKDWRELEIGRLLLLTDISDRRKAQVKILEQQRVLATLKERDLLARELHDDLAQVLSFIHTQSQTINRLLDRGEKETAQEYLERLVEVSRRGESDIRESILGMRLSSTDGGLMMTLNKYLDQFQRTHQIQTELLVPEMFAGKRLDAMVEVQVLRILQEALTNISKHAQAEQVRIKFDIEDGILCIIVKDDGVGFDFVNNQAVLRDHFGLQMMRERAEAIGGKIDLTSQPGQGTEIRVCVPIDKGWQVDE
jgi:PAS domain S-box-containing protein